VRLITHIGTVQGHAHRAGGADQSPFRDARSCPRAARG